MWVWLRLLVGWIWIFLNAIAFLITNMAPELEIFAESGAQIPVMQLAATVSQVFLGIALLAVAPGVLDHMRNISIQFKFFLTMMLVAATPLLLAFMILFLFLRVLLSDNLNAYVRFGSLLAMIITPRLLTWVVYQSLCYLRLVCSQETISSPLFGPFNAIINALQSLTIEEVILRIIESVARIVESIARVIEPILDIFKKIVQIIVIPIRAFTEQPDPTPYHEYTEHQFLRRNQLQHTHSGIALKRVLVLSNDTSVQSSSCIPSVSQLAPSTSNGHIERNKTNTTSQQLKAGCYFSSQHFISSSAAPSTSTSSTNSTASMIAMTTTSRSTKGKRTSKKSKNKSGRFNQDNEELESFTQDVDESHHISSDVIMPCEDLVFEHGHPKYDPPPYHA